MSATVDSFPSGWRGAAAILVDCHLTVAASSGLAEALFPGLRAGDNLARQVFLGSPGQDPLCALDASAQIVAALQASRGKDDDGLGRLVGELSALSRGFSSAWAYATEPLRPSGVVRSDHPALGPMSLRYELVRLSASDDIVIVWQGGDPASVAALARLAPRR